MRRNIAKLAILAMVAALGACGVSTNQPSADEVDARRQAAITREGAAEVGMPAIHKFTEKRLARLLYELRDEEKLSTWTYVKDMNGGLWEVCHSVGYPLPYGVQYSNPEVRVRDYVVAGGVKTNFWDPHNMPQAEPNGLFMPPTAEGTWVQCVGPGGQLAPMYVEDRVEASQWRLHSVGKWVPAS